MTHSLLVSPNPFEFMQLREDSKVVLVLLPTFVNVVFYDAARCLSEATGIEGCPSFNGSESGSTQAHLPV